VNATPRATRLAWLALAAAMCVSATWLMIAGRDLSFASDDLFYYAHYVAHGSEITVAHGLEYLLAPSNGHLQVAGKLLYGLLFDIAGGNYTVFRAVNVAGVMLCIGLFFELSRGRIGPIPALVPCVSLLFLGFAWEPLLWAFDMHTTFALALGLGAILMLRRGDLRGDVLACVLLVLSVGMIELGLAFAIGIAVSVLLRPDRWRRLWIFLVPIALYGCWWLWARHFDQSSIELSNVRLIPATFANGLAAVAGSVFGFNPTGAGVYQPITEVTAAGMVVAGVAVVGLVARIKRGSVPSTLWIFLAVVLSYWALIALGGRGADSSRYILVATLLVFLVGADALVGIGLRWPALAAAACVVALAIPANVAKLNDGRGPQANDGRVGRTEYAMLDLARGHVDPDYAPGRETPVVNAGGSTFTALPAGDYLRAAREIGSLGYSQSEIPDLSPTLRRIADVSLAGALGVKLRPSAPPADRAGCSVARAAGPGQGVAFRLPRGGALLGVPGHRTVGVGILRFGEPTEPSLPLAKLADGGWATLRIPADSDPVPWQVFADGPVVVCQL
jgi:hypothetical protein